MFCFFYSGIFLVVAEKRLYEPIFMEESMKKKLACSGAALGLLGLGIAGTLLYYKNRPTIPEGIEAVKGFDLKRYLGRWYEICRMPMRYEKGLTRVTAEYSLNADGSVRVVNSGFDERSRRWRKSTGKAIFADDPNEAKLKVSFFGPFYAGYNVVAIDEDYQYALVFGRTLDYMWILARDPDVPEKILRKYVEKAAAAGYDYYRLIWTEQEEF